MPALCTTTYHRSCCIGMERSESSEGSVGSSKIFSRVAAKKWVFFAQIGVIFAVLITCLVNLSLNQGEQNLWKYLLCSIVGYILPNPTLKQQHTNGHV